MTTQPPRFSNTPSHLELGVLGIALLAATGTVRAEQEIHGSVTAGVGVLQIDHPSAMFGKLNGLTDDGAYLIGMADVQARDGQRYWNLLVDDIGLNNRHVDLEGGLANKYRIRLNFRSQDNLISNNSFSPYQGVGSSELTLPAGFVRSGTTTGMTTLPASLTSANLGTRHEDGKLEFSYALNEHVDVTASFRRYVKDGVKSVGMVMLFPYSVVLPEPVNYQTDELRGGIAWHGKRGEARLDYYYSQFDNANSALTWANPFFGPDQGRASLAPDNHHQTLSLSGSLALTPTTRLSALYEWGSMRQNESLLPYTINPGVVINTPVPHSTADARIDTQLLKLELAIQPLPGISLHGQYRHYDTDNKTPRALYQRVVADASIQGGANTTGALYNNPLDYKQDQLSLDAAYHFGYGTSLKLAYDYDRKNYRYRAVETTDEDRYSARLKKNWENGASAYLELGHGRKRSDGYNERRVFESMRTATCIGQISECGNFDTHPSMRQFDIADRERFRQALGISLLPRPDLVVGMSIDRNLDEYNASKYGLHERDATAYTVDATLTPNESSSLSVYFTRQDIAARQRNRAFDTEASALANSSADEWSAKNQDTIDTLGINLNFNLLADKLGIGLGYAYSRITTDIIFDAASGRMPTALSKRHTLDLSGSYNLDETLTVQAGALLEIYHADDWATDGLAPGTVPVVLTLSGSTPSYRALLLSTALKYRF